MLYAVIKRNELHGFQCGIDRDGTEEPRRKHIELMTEAEAAATAAKYGGVVVADDERLYPDDYV